MSSSSKEVSTLIKQGFIPEHFHPHHHNQDPSFSPSRSVTSSLVSSRLSLLAPPPPITASSSPTQPLPGGNGARPTLHEMSHDDASRCNSISLHQATQKDKILRILSAAPFGNSVANGGGVNNGSNNDGKDSSYGGVNGGGDVGFLGSGDVRLTVVSRDGFRVSLDVHRQVLGKKNRYFAEKLSDEKGGFGGSGAVEVEIGECDDVEVYVEVVVMMYADDLRSKFVGEGISQVLGLLKVSSAVLYDEGVAECFDFLEAVPWSNEEEEKVISQLRQLHLHELAGEILLRVSTDASTSTRTDEIFLRLLTGVLQALEDKARREMKLLISQLLKEESTDHSNKLDVAWDTLYHLCHRCLSSLILSLSEATGEGDGKRYVDRGNMMAEIARAADNMPWLVEILIQKNVGEEFTRLGRSEGACHPSLEDPDCVPAREQLDYCPALHRHREGAGPGAEGYPAFAALDVEALYEDYNWMRRASSKTLDKKLLEDGHSQTILTLPLAQQQAIILNWFDRFLNKGDDCLNIQRTFEVWWSRAFGRLQAGEPNDSQRQITVSQ